MLYVMLQESFYSYALKSLVSISTVILLCLIVAYHWLLVQVYSRVYVDNYNK